MTASSPCSLPWRLRLARHVVGRWPLPRGRRWIRRVMLQGLEPVLQQTRASFDFSFGRLVDTSLRPWPYGYLDIYLHGVFEPGEVAIWRAVLQPGDTVVDGGANIGYWTLVGSHLVGAQGLVLAYEPSTDTRARLQANLDASRAANVTVRPCGLWKAAAQLDLHVHTDDPMGIQSSFGLRADLPAVATVSAPLVALDDEPLLKDRFPALLKLDVEGAELRALQGARRLLADSRRPVITFEWNPTTAAALGCAAPDILTYLAGFGYSFHLAHGSRLVPFEPRPDDPDWTPMVWCLDARQIARLPAHVRT